MRASLFEVRSSGVLTYIYANSLDKVLTYCERVYSPGYKVVPILWDYLPKGTEVLSLIE